MDGVYGYSGNHVCNVYNVAVSREEGSKRRPV